MHRDELTAVTGITRAGAAALGDIGITTLMDLVLAPRPTVRAALKGADIDPLPSLSDIAGWQDRARKLRLESPPSPGWEREASFVVSFERREGDHDEEERQTVVAVAESDAPLQYVHADWSPEAIAAWIGARVESEHPGGRGPAVSASPANSPATAPRAGASVPDNVIRHWNAVALEANRSAHTMAATLPAAEKEVLGPTGSARALALVHLAMYDAYFSITKAEPPYLAGHTPPVDATSEADAEAAAEGAAQAALSALYPSLVATGSFALPATAAGLAAARTFGSAVAARILDDRKDDPTISDQGYAPSKERRRHRADPTAPGQGYYGPRVGGSRCFAVTTRHRLLDPPADGSEPYLRAARQVRGLGVIPELAGTLPESLERRTVDQTAAGLFWAYDGPSGLGTPPRLYNQIVRIVSRQKGNSTAQDARLFARVNVAMADAGVLAWFEKYEYDLWRPVLGLREHDPSMGADGVATPGTEIGDDCDPDWLPLGAPRTNPHLDTPASAPRARGFTPPFPAYPSGHATFGAAALQTVRLFYSKSADGPDDLFPGHFVSDELDGVARDERGYVRSRHARTFPGGLWQMIEENGRSRVYLGVHWIFDAFAEGPGGTMDLSQDVGGVPLGLAIARDIHDHGLVAANAAGAPTP